MAAIAFDPLEYTHELEASGVPREQAEVHAKAMTARFIHNFDALVTRDYLDTRFTEFGTRIEATMDRRFGEVDGRFTEIQANMYRRFAEVDKRFTEMQANMGRRFTEVDQRFTEMETNTDSKFRDMESSLGVRFAQVDVRFERVEGRFLLMYWMQGLTIACVVIPAIRDFLA
jgi:replicative DNA helicase